jgi:predicted enzyme related to lactoylglutathione lyase
MAMRSTIGCRSNDGDLSYESRPYLSLVNLHGKYVPVDTLTTVGVGWRRPFRYEPVRDTKKEPMNIHRTNTILYCKRWAATVAFYRDRIRLPVLLQNAWFVEFRLTGNGCLSVADAARTSINSAGGAGITLSWQVDDIDCWYDRMVSDGIDVSPIAVIWGARAFHLFDPEGNRIELWS